MHDLTDDDRRLVDEAVRIAAESVETRKGGPFGAVVARYGAILARGSNRVVATNDPTAHAEIVAIREACRVLGSFSLAGCTLFASCEPCPMCLAAAMWARVSRVVYAADRHDAAEAGFDDAHFHEQLALPPAARKLPTFHVPHADARRAFELWRAWEDRTEY